MTPLPSTIASLSAFLLFLPASAGAGATVNTAGCGNETPHAYISVNVASTAECYAILPPFGQYAIVYVSINSVPWQKARFTLPDPSFATVVGETWYVPFTGTRTAGLEFSAACPGEGITALGELLIYIPTLSITGCPAWAPADGCEIEDCAGVVHPAEAWDVFFSNSEICIQCFQQCQGLPPYDLFPPDGATNVPLNVQLSWAGPPHYTDDPNAVSCSVTISTDPACGSVRVSPADCVTKTFSPDFLEPGTTYYWFASYGYTGSGCSSGNVGVSATYSFTTAGVVGVESATWGRVKALYRE